MRFVACMGPYVSTVNNKWGRVWNEQVVEQTLDVAVTSGSETKKSRDLSGLGFAG